MALIKRAVARYHMLHHYERSRVARSAEVRASSRHLPAAGREPLDGPATRRGHGRRRGPLLRHEPAQGTHREPGYEKMLAIAKAMGFPPEAWFEDVPQDSGAGRLPEGRDLAARVESPLRDGQAPEDRASPTRTPRSPA